MTSICPSEMINLKLVFDIENLLGLTSEQFNQLVLAGETVTDFAPAKDYSIGNEDYPRLLLCFDSAASDYFFQFDAEGDINIFTKNSSLATLFPKTGILKLLTDYAHPLHEFLLTADKVIMKGQLIERESFRTEQKVFTDVLDENAVYSLLETGNFKGQVACCDCGEAGCSSAYLWAKESIGLITFHIVAAQLTQVRLFPFRLT